MVYRSIRWCFEGDHFYSITGEVIESPYKNYKAGQREYLERLAKGHCLTLTQESQS